MIYDWLRNIVFIWPENFILLGLIPFLIWRYITNEGRDKGSIMTSVWYTGIPQTFKTRMRHLPFVFRMLAILCLIMALARPQHQTDRSRTEGDGIDIVLCMDVSASMNTNDVKPSRFDVAKEELLSLLKAGPWIA